MVWVLKAEQLYKSRCFAVVAVYVAFVAPAMASTSLYHWLKSCLLVFHSHPPLVACSLKLCTEVVDDVALHPSLVVPVTV